MKEMIRGAKTLIYLENDEMGITRHVRIRTKIAAAIDWWTKFRVDGTPSLSSGWTPPFSPLPGEARFTGVWDSFGRGISKKAEKVEQKNRPIFCHSEKKPVQQ